MEPSHLRAASFGTDGMGPVGTDSPGFLLFKPTLAPLTIETLRVIVLVRLRLKV